MNRKKEILIAVIAIIMMIIIGQSYIIHNQARFDGNRVCSKNPNRFYLNFNLMNKDDSETMVLNEGETLHLMPKDGWKSKRKMTDDSREK